MKWFDGFFCSWKQFLKAKVYFVSTSGKKPPLTVLISRGVKSSGDMYITSLNPNTFSYLKWTKPIHMLCLISYKASQHEFCNNEKIIVFAQRHFCSTQLESWTFRKLNDHYISYTQSVLIRNGPIRNTSEIFGFLKKWLVTFSKLRNPTGHFFQSKKRQSFCI